MPKPITFNFINKPIAAVDLPQAKPNLPQVNLQPTQTTLPQSQVTAPITLPSAQITSQIKPAAIPLTPQVTQNFFPQFGQVVITPTNIPLFSKDLQVKREDIISDENEEENSSKKSGMENIGTEVKKLLQDDSGSLDIDRVVEIFSSIKKGIADLAQNIPFLHTGKNEKQPDNVNVVVNNNEKTPIIKKLIENINNLFEDKEEYKYVIEELVTNRDLYQLLFDGKTDKAAIKKKVKLFRDCKSMNTTPDEKIQILKNINKSFSPEIQEKYADFLNSKDDYRIFIEYMDILLRNPEFIEAKRQNSDGLFLYALLAKCMEKIPECKDFIIKNIDNIVHYLNYREFLNGDFNYEFDKEKIRFFAKIFKNNKFYSAEFNEIRYMNKAKKEKLLELAEIFKNHNNILTKDIINNIDSLSVEECKKIALADTEKILDISTLHLKNHEKLANLKQNHPKIIEFIKNGIVSLGFILNIQDCEVDITSVENSIEKLVNSDTYKSLNHLITNKILGNCYLPTFSIEEGEKSLNEAEIETGINSFCKIVAADKNNRLQELFSEFGDYILPNAEKLPDILSSDKLSKLEPSVIINVAAIFDKAMGEKIFDKLGNRINHFLNVTINKAILKDTENSEEILDLIVAIYIESTKNFDESVYDNIISEINPETIDFAKTFFMDTKYKELREKHIVLARHIINAANKNTKDIVEWLCTSEESKEFRTEKNIRHFEYILRNLSWKHYDLINWVLKSPESPYRTSENIQYIPNLFHAINTNENINFVEKILKNSEYSFLKTSENIKYITDIIEATNKSNQTFAEWICTSPESGFFRTFDNVKYISDIIFAAEKNPELAKKICKEPENEVFRKTDNIIFIPIMIEVANEFGIENVKSIFTTVPQLMIERKNELKSGEKDLTNEQIYAFVGNNINIICQARKILSESDFINCFGLKLDGLEKFLRGVSWLVTGKNKEAILEIFNPEQSEKGKEINKNIEEVNQNNKELAFSGITSCIATDEDLREIQKIDLEAFDGRYEIDFDFQDYKKDLEEQGITTYVIKSKNSVLGYYQLEPSENGELYIYSIGMNKKLKNTKSSFKFLHKLHKDITEFAKQNHIRKIVLDVDTDKTNLIKLYKKFGFEITGENRGIEDGHPYHDYSMEINITDEKLNEEAEKIKKQETKIIELMKNNSKKIIEQKTELSQMKSFTENLHRKSMREFFSVLKMFIAMNNVSPDAVNQLIEIANNPDITDKKEAIIQFVNKKIFEKYDIPYSKELSDKLGLDKSEYLSELLATTDSRFINNFSLLLNLIKDNPSSISKVLQTLPQNEVTKDVYKNNGINYGRWINVNENSYKEVTVTLNSDAAKQALITSLEQDFNDEEFKLIPQAEQEKLFKALKKKGIILKEIEETVFDENGFATGARKVLRLYKDESPVNYSDMNDVISTIKDVLNKEEFWNKKNNSEQIEEAKNTMYNHFIKMRGQEFKNIENGGSVDKTTNLRIRQVDMTDLPHTLFLGNQAGCCTAVGTGCNQFSAPAYIMNRLIGGIEITDGKTAVGNTMMYIAEVDGIPSLVLDNIEVKGKYQFNDNIRDAFFDYVKQFVKEIGKPDMPIYAGPYRHKLNMPEETKQQRTVKILGSTGGQEVYIDYAGHYKVNGGTLTPVLYKIQ